MKLQILCVVVLVCGVSCINRNIFRKYLVSRQERLLERGHKNSESKENDVFDDDDVVTITCGEGEVISVVNANYGNPAKPRKPGKGGKHGKEGKGGKSGKDQCSDPQSLVKVVGACNGQQACEFTVSDLFNEDDCLNEEELEARSDGSASCCCDEGYTGDQCDKFVDECTVNPCENGGICRLNNDGLEICNCVMYFFGPACQYKYLLSIS
ncbi:unnamed protein product [Mytilus coruscus]|uniref:EGF-like domain-containing protein n=1 Tax=Mytilus coruscus TaxID=42192 RepID=A0A6J8DXU2_MYTCO|nr:unnamed protein product [Mytilus coruscus]